LESELEIGAVLSVTVGEAQFNKDTQSQTLMDITVSGAYPMISAITMIAPSPDWFSGFYDFDARNAATQTWFKSFTITTYPWDAGTEQGSTYSPDNMATSPKASIKQLTAATVPSTGVFLNTTTSMMGSKTVKPVATWTCTIESEPVCKTTGNTCVSGIQCCGGRCVNDVCLAARPEASRQSSSLGSRAGLGGSAGRPINVGGGGRGGSTGGTAGRPINIAQGGGRE
jgi:Spondin_N